MLTSRRIATSSPWCSFCGRHACHTPPMTDVVQNPATTHEDPNQPQRVVRRRLAPRRRRPPALLDRPPGGRADDRSTTTARCAGRARPHAGQPGGIHADVARPRQEGHLLPVGRVPDGSAARQQPAQPRHRGRGPRGAGGARARTSTSCWPARRSRAWATAASAGWPRAISTRWRRSSCRRSATASATSSASSTRRSATAGRSRCTDKWLRYGNPWEIARPEIALPRQLRRPHRALRTTTHGRYRVRWMPARRSSTASPTTRPIPGYRRRHRATRCGCGAPRPPSRSTSTAFNDGDYYGAVEEKVDVREHLQGALPERRARGGQASCASSSSTSSSSCSLQDMLAHLLHAARPVERLRREVRGPAQRHAPVDRGRRADAAARRRARAGLGRGLGHHRGRPSPTPTTRCCPRRSRRWPLALFGELLPRHLEIIYEINRALPRRGARALPRRRRRALRAHVAHRRGRRAARAHGAPRDASAATPSTASPRCTPSCSSETCCATSTSCGPSSSPTRPTA